MSAGDEAARAAWNAKFEEIVAQIGRMLFGEGRLTHEQGEQARDEAEDAVEMWEEATASQIEPLVVDTELKRLLAEQHDIAEGILGPGQADEGRANPRDPDGG